jgi:transposase
MLSHDFPPWQTVYGYFNTWPREGVWETMNKDYEQLPETSEAMIYAADDSMSVPDIEQCGIIGQG